MILIVSPLPCPLACEMCRTFGHLHEMCETIIQSVRIIEQINEIKRETEGLLLFATMPALERV